MIVALLILALLPVIAFYVAALIIMGREHGWIVPAIVVAITAWTLGGTWMLAQVVAR